MGEDEKTQDKAQDKPLPPLPPGISLPLPPPPPPPLEEVDLEDNLEEDIELENFDGGVSENPPSSDFQSHWEKRKASDPNLSVGNRESMYGHIDRIATGEVGTLLDRFSNRFGSELDREIIVLRKKQQQEMREIKPTVELIQAPSEEYEAESDEGDEEYSEDLDFAEFFSVINNLLGEITDEDAIKDFIASESFSLFEKVGSSPESTSDDEKEEFFKLINHVLGDLPDDNKSVEAFIRSSDFSLFEKMGELYGG